MSLRVFVVVGLTLLGCAHAPKRVAASHSEDLTPYYPLAVGNKWVYQVNQSGQRGDVEIVKREGDFFIDSRGAKLRFDAFGLRDDKRYLLREPVEAGKTWTNVVSVSSAEHYQVMEAGIPCHVPAGKFEGCVRVGSRNRASPEVTLINEMTFAPNVGIVKIETFLETGGRQVRQVELLLVDYTVAGVQPR